jgi:outer membrane protein assembly factor BamB
MKDSATPATPWTRPIRWWPAAVLGLLALAAAIAIVFGDSEDEQKRTMQLMLIGILLGFGLLAWLLFFSRLPGRVRKRIALGTLAAAVFFFAFFRIQGFTGNLLPVVEPRFGGGPPLAATSTTAAVDIAGSPFDFPQFRGAARDGRVAGVRLDRDWNAKPPRELWRRPVGEGWSGFAVVGQLAVTQEQRENQEVVAAYDLATGEPLWSHAAPGHFDNALGGNGPRGTPTIEGGQVFTFGPTGLLRALDLSTGKLSWSRPAAEENGGKVPEWGFAGSPLLVGELVVVSVGGPDGRSLVAYRRADGEKVWSGGDDRAGYSSLQLATLAGRQQIVAFNHGSVAGHDPASGEVLWSFPWPSQQANVALPLLVGDDRLLVSSGYGVGSALLEVKQAGQGFEAKQIWHSNQMKAKFTNLVEKDGKVYGLDDGIFACLDLATGERCWKGGRYGHGQLLLVGELIVLLAENGELVLIEPDPAGLKELGRFPALSGKSWNTFALSGAKLLVRNHQEAACFELPLAG